MSANPQGIFNYSKMNDIDKSYLVKIIATIILAIFTGIITGFMYEPNSTAISAGMIGFSLWLIGSVASIYILNLYFDMGDWTSVRVFRHGVFVSLLTYLFFWIVIFNFIINGRGFINPQG